MGNICRSPTAEGVTRTLAERYGLMGLFEFDSAGTHGYHIGNPPDERTRLAARQRGFDLSTLRARQVDESDYERFDYLMAMDRENLKLLQQVCPEVHRSKLRLFLESAGTPEDEVPDPYYGGPEGFERVLDLVETGAEALIRQLTGK